jgi:hypothetical protein
MRPLVIAGANLVLNPPEGMENCIPIYVRRDVIDGIPYTAMELELDEEERKNLLNGGTLQISQAGAGWVPIAVNIIPNPALPVEVVDAVE